MNKAEQAREYAKLARELAKEQPWAAVSHRDTARAWDRAAERYEKRS